MTFSTGSVDEARRRSIEVFFDGACPLCVREIRMLQRRDKHNAIQFTDIADENFDPRSYGKTQTEFMEQIQGRDEQGNWLTGVEVFRRLYGAVGFEKAVAVSRWPVVSQALNLGYSVFARNRLKWTGRCDNGRCAVT